MTIIRPIDCVVWLIMAFLGDLELPYLGKGLFLIWVARTCMSAHACNDYDVMLQAVRINLYKV